MTMTQRPRPTLSDPMLLHFGYQQNFASECVHFRYFVTHAEVSGNTILVSLLPCTLHRLLCSVVDDRAARHGTQNQLMQLVGSGCTVGLCWNARILTTPLSRTFDLSACPLVS